MTNTVFIFVIIMAWGMPLIGVVAIGLLAYIAKKSRWRAGLTKFVLIAALLLTVVITAVGWYELGQLFPPGSGF